MALPRSDTCHRDLLISTAGHVAASSRPRVPLDSLTPLPCLELVSLAVRHGTYDGYLFASVILYEVKALDSAAFILPLLMEWERHTGVEIPIFYPYVMY